MTQWLISVNNEGAVSYRIGEGPRRSSSSVQQIGDFWNPNPVQNFLLVIRSDPNPVDMSKYLIQSGLYPKKRSD